ncbi:MAG TPA: hypothetical protein VG722_00590 [Tepidisphaeraceae bacterium]|nr:hypothetical protein [Tepidisphaeraceae bacterium]
MMLAQKEADGGCYETFIVVKRYHFAEGQFQWDDIGGRNIPNLAVMADKERSFKGICIRYEEKLIRRQRVGLREGQAEKNDKKGGKKPVQPRHLAARLNQHIALRRG